MHSFSALYRAFCALADIEVLPLLEMGGLWWKLRSRHTGRRRVILRGCNFLKKRIKSVSVSHLLQNPAVWLEFLLLTEHLPCAETVSQRMSGCGILKHFCQGVNPRALHSHQVITTNSSVRPCWVASNWTCLETISPFHVPCSFVREPVGHWQTVDVDIHLCFRRQFFVPEMNRTCKTELHQCGLSFFPAPKFAWKTPLRKLTEKFNSQIMSLQSEKHTLSYWALKYYWINCISVKHPLCTYTWN